MQKITRKQALDANNVSGHLSTMSRDITHWQVQDSNLRHRLYRLACLVDYRCLPFTAVPQRIPPMNIPPAIPPVTVPARIRRLTDRRWRPQDVGRVQKITLALAGVGLRHRRALASAGGRT